MCVRVSISKLLVVFLFSKGPTNGFTSRVEQVLEARQTRRHAQKASLRIAQLPLINSRKKKKQTTSSALFSAFSLSHSNEIGHRQSRPVNECLKREREGLGGEKQMNNTGRNWKIGERENANSRNYHERHFTLQHFARSTELYCSTCLISFYM